MEKKFTQITTPPPSNDGKGLDSRIVKMDKAQKSEVTSFEFGNLNRQEKKSYSSIKASFSGVGGLTEGEKQAHQLRDSRFSLNPMARTHLSIEEEEKKIIDEKVKAQIALISEEAKTKAMEEGYQVGLKKGFDEAFTQFRDEGNVRLKQFDAFITSVEDAKTVIFAANERYLIELVFRVAKMILLRELTTDKEYVLRLCKELIEKVGVRDNVSIRIHPDDMESMTMLREGLEKSLGAMKNLNIETSNQVKRGGCILETEWNAIEASIDTQIQGVYDALVGTKPGTEETAT